MTVLKRLVWYWKCDRLGPDIPMTHVFLYFKSTSRWICRRKFKSFGENAEFRPHAYAIHPSNISIGKNVIIHPGTMLFSDETKEGTIIIEDDVSIGSGVHFYVDNHRYDRVDIPIKYQGFYPSRPVRVCRGSWVGANAIVLLGVTIGQNAVVGAGAVVTRDVDPFTVVAGVPARIIRRIKS